MYNAKITYLSGRQVATIYKSKEAKMTEAYIKEQVENLKVPINFPWINKNTLFKMTIRVVFRSGIFLRDLDNTIKLVQDGIFRALDINDSHVVSIVADKVLLPDVADEKIFVCLDECDSSGVRFDFIPRPRIIWSEDYSFPGLSLVPEKRIMKSKQYRTDQQEKADTFVYLVTPENLTFIKSAQIISRVTESVVGSSGFVFIGILESDLWGKDIDEFKSLIYDYEKEYSGIKVKEFKSFTEKELLDWMNV